MRVGLEFSSSSCCRMLCERDGPKKPADPLDGADLDT